MQTTLNQLFSGTMLLQVHVGLSDHGLMGKINMRVDIESSGTFSPDTYILIIK